MRGPTELALINKAEWTDEEFFASASNLLQKCEIMLADLSKRVDAHKADPEYKVARLADFYVQIKQVKDKIDEISKTVNATQQHMAYTVIPERFEAEELTTFTTASGFRVTTSALVRASINNGEEAKLTVYTAVGKAFLDEGDAHDYANENTDHEFQYSVSSTEYVGKEAAYKWLELTGNEGLIQETVNSSTLSAFAKSEMSEARELPAALFNTHVGMNTSVTKVAKNKEV
jgi:hypothetical protein